MGGSVRFSVFSRHAAAVTLLLFDDPRSPAPSREIPLDPRSNRTGDAWHVDVNGVAPGAYYLYRVDGPWQPEKGHRFDPGRLLLDPYVKAVAGSYTWSLLGSGRDATGARERPMPPSCRKESWSRTISTGRAIGR